MIEPQGQTPPRIAPAFAAEDKGPFEVAVGIRATSQQQVERRLARPIRIGKTYDSPSKRPDAPFVLVPSELWPELDEGSGMRELDPCRAAHQK